MKIAIDLNDVIRSYTSQFATFYKKGIDKSFDIDNVDIYTNELDKVFPFKSERDYQNFVYVDYPYELFGTAEPMHRRLPHRMNDWLQNDLANMDVEKPEVILVSPYEFALTIQSTHFFLSKTASRVRECYFPDNSTKIWDRCDILITANPKLLDTKPEGKITFKIKAPYNKESVGDYEFESFMNVMDDPNGTIEKIIKEKEENENV